MSAYSKLMTVMLMPRVSILMAAFFAIAAAMATLAMVGTVQVNFWDCIDTLITNAITIYCNRY